MVIEGAARGGPAALAAHLLRTDHNESVNVLDIWGTGAPELKTALAEMHAIGAGAISKRTLYHANIDPSKDEQLTPEQKGIAVARLGQHLGFEGQPYAVVEHVKNGRQHLHVVWSRIDLKTMTAIHDGHNFRKHEEVAHELGREFGHRDIPRVHIRDKQIEPRPTPAPKFAEYQQTARSGMTPQQAKARITECWQQTATGLEFRQRLEAEGFTLARGDRRDFVLVDRAGEIHGLTRRIATAKAADVRQRLADIDVERIPDVAEARRQLQARPQGREGVAVPVGVVERIRAEERQQEARARTGTGGRLNIADQDVADAIWQLNKTMRGQMDATIATSQPNRPSPSQDQPTSARNELAAERATAAAKAIQRLSIEVDDRAREKPIEQQPEAERPRPSASLFIRVFGWLVEHYQRTVDRRAAELTQEKAATARPTPPQKRESLFEAALRKKSERTPEQADHAAQRLRDREKRNKHPGDREYS